MSKALGPAIARMRKASSEMIEVLKRDYPVASRLFWSRNGVQSGNVVMHSNGERLKVRSAKTGKEYWIYLFDICDYRGNRFGGW